MTKEGKKKSNEIVAITDIDESKVPPSPEESVCMKEMFFLRWIFVWFTKFVIEGVFKTPTLQTIPALQSTSKVKYLESKFDYIWAKTEGIPFRLWICLNYCFGIEFWFGGFVQLVGIVAQVFLPKTMEKYIRLLFTPEENETVVTQINYLRSILPKSSPIYPGEASEYYRSNNWEIWIWLGLLSAIYMFATWSLNYGIQVGTVVGMKIRSIIIAKIYEKSLNMSNKARDKFENGVIVNHCTMDALIIAQMHMMFHYGWASWIMLIGSVYFIIDLIDWGALAGFGTAGLSLPVIIVIVSGVMIFRVYIVKKIDERTNRTNEVLQGIKIIKFFGWEKSFFKKVKKIRRMEIFGTRLIYGCFSVMISLMITLTTFMCFASFITFFFVHDRVDTIAFFTSLTYYNMMRLPMMIAPVVIVMTGQMLISLMRIEKFLACEELEPVTRGKSKKYPIIVKDADFQWETKKKKGGANGGKKKKNPLMLLKKCIPSKKTEEEEEEEVQEENPESGYGKLQNINFKVKKGQLVAVVGGVGSGKSSLLAGIMGEMKLKKGSVKVSEDYAYTSQQAWMKNGTLYDNVLFGEQEDKDRWEHCVDVCGLTEDLKMLKGGKNIEIGEKGINLSGGQKYRVQLARACYSKEDLVLLDDPLAAVDAHVGKHIFYNCIKGWLKDRTRVLVTHQLSYLKEVDYVLYLNEGTIKEQGTYQELMKKQGELYQLVTEFAEKEEEGAEKDNKNEYVKKDLSQMKEEEEEEEENKIMSKEVQHKGVVHPKYFWYYFSSIGPFYGIPGLIFIVFILILAQTIKTGSDWWLSEWTNLTFNVQYSKKYDLPMVFSGFSEDGDSIMLYYNANQYTYSNTSNMTTLDPYLNNTYSPILNTTTGELNCTGVLNNFAASGMDVSPYYEYYSDDHYCPSIFGFCGCIYNTIDAQWASDYENKDDKIEDGISHNTSIYIYGGLGIFTFFAMFVRSIVMSNSGLSASQKIHNDALRGVMAAPMSFFDTTPIGRITNRFTNDIINMDGMMVQALMQALGMGMSCLGMFFMISYSTSGLGLLFVVPLLIFYVLFYLLYRKTNLEIKRLESISRSPLMSHISESLNGLPTIRAYRAEERFMNELRYKLDLNNRAYFLMMTAQRWLSLYLGLIGVIFIFFVCTLCILFLYYVEVDWKVSYISLAVSYSIQATQMFFGVVEQVTQFEVQMNGVERLSHYIRDIDQEKARFTSEEVKRSIGDKWEEWPTKGVIEFKDYSMAYREGLPLVIKNLSLKIKDKEKIGIVGRTGSGKSSLMVALFRIVEPSEGDILIDGVSIKSLGLEDLRTKMAIIPQDATLFTGTIRSNLDPFNEHTDKEVWECLKKSFLEKKVRDMPRKLNSDVKEGGSNFSIGERQLLCLARAILRNAKILILDECTASVDLKTDNLIQKTIRREFKNVTTLTIAHRLNTIIDSDRVLVLSDGEIAEFGTPKKLVDNKEGALRKLIEETGAANSQYLIKVARGDIVLEDTDDVIPEDLVDEGKEIEMKQFSRGGEKEEGESEEETSTSDSETTSGSEEGSESEDSSEEEN